MTSSSWFSKGIVILLAVVVILWFLTIIAPLGSAIMVGLSLALLGTPLILLPCEQALTRWYPGLPVQTRHWLAACVATAGMGMLGLFVAAVLLFALLGGVGTTLYDAWGAVLGRHAAIDNLVFALEQRCGEAAALWPRLGIDPKGIGEAVRNLFTPGGVGPAMLHRLAGGAGGLLAELALVMGVLFYVFACGPWLVSRLFDNLAFSQPQRQHIIERYRATAIHLLVGIGGRALAHGLTLALLAWVIGGWPPMLVAVVATVLALLPIVGPAVAWIPLTLTLAATGSHMAAGFLALSAIAAAVLIEWSATRLASRLESDHVWLAFIVFLGVLGGILGWGPGGLAIGPAAALAIVTMREVVLTTFAPSGDLKPAPDQDPPGPNNAL